MPTTTPKAQRPTDQEMAEYFRKESARMEHGAEYNVSETKGWTTAQIAGNNAMIYHARLLTSWADALEASASETFEQKLERATNIMTERRNDSQFTSKDVAREVLWAAGITDGEVVSSQMLDDLGVEG